MSLSYFFGSKNENPIVNQEKARRELILDKEQYFLYDRVGGICQSYYSINELITDRNFDENNRIKIISREFMGNDPIKESIYSKDHITIPIVCDKCDNTIIHKVYSWFYDEDNVWDFCYPSPVYKELYLYFLIIHLRNCEKHYDRNRELHHYIASLVIDDRDLKECVTPEHEGCIKCFDSNCACYHRKKIGENWRIIDYEGKRHIESTKAMYPYERKYPDSHYVDKEKVFNIIRSRKDIKKDFCKDTRKRNRNRFANGSNELI